MHAFWLVLTYDLLEDRRIDDVIIKTFFNSLLYKTNRFQVAVHLFSNRSQRTSKCGKNISDTLGCALCATFLFLPHFDVICDLLLNRHTATWNLFVNYIISSVMHAFWLVLTYDLLEDRRIDDFIIKTFFNSLLYKTNRFQVAVRLFSNRSQMTSKCGKNKKWHTRRSLNKNSIRNAYSQFVKLRICILILGCKGSILPYLSSNSAWYLNNLLQTHGNTGPRMG